MIRVIQIIDSLQTGGAERVAVNYANGLVKLVDASHICATRTEGPLRSSIELDVGYIHLNKKSVLDFKAILKLKRYVSRHKINIIHAHSSSFFIAVLIKMIVPKVKIVWHDHYGNSEFLDKRPKKVLRIASRFFSQIFSVNKQLKEWSESNLVCKQVKYVKNFPVLKKSKLDQTMLTGKVGKRVLCLANLREQKNHLRLLEAFEIVKNEYPDWTLHCIGKDFKDAYSELFFSKLKALNLEKHVNFYDSKTDILNILEQASIAILPSKSEGLPLALLEYGISKLPVIASNVGQCGILVPNNSYGILLENDNKSTIASAIICYINDKDFMKASAEKFSRKIAEEYSANVILKTVSKIYIDIINK